MSDAEWHSRRPDLPKTHYVDNAIYYDKIIFEEEQEKIQKKVWLFVCHESELAKPNDFRTTTVAGVPLVLMRGKDNIVRAFHNICSHRGAEVVRSPAGNSRTHICLFHRWGFNTSGECAAMPRKDAYEHCGIGPRSSGLKPVRTEVRLGLVFVNMDDDAESLSEFLGNSLESVEEVLGTQEMEVFHFHKVFIHSNWKLWQETNMELYHEYLHVANRKSSLQQEEYFARRWKTYPNGHAMVEPFQPDYTKYAGWEARSQGVLPGLKPDEFRVADLFPDLMINVRSTVVRLDRLVPLAPGLTLVEHRGLGLKADGPEERALRLRHHNQFWGPFGRNLPEDALAVEAQWKALSGKGMRYSIHAREEDGLAQDDISLRAFYREWSRRMGRSSCSPSEEPTA